MKMRIYFRGLISLASTAIACVANAQTDTAWAQLKQGIYNELSSQKGSFAVAFSDISTGRKILINEREAFHAASTMKTPVMIEAFRQASKKKFSMDDSLVVKNEFKSIADGSLYSLDSSDDGETDLYKYVGKKAVIYDLVYKMITVSSNLATNNLIEKVGAGNVTHTMKKLGAPHLQVLRGVEDNKAFQKGLNNMLTAYDLMVVYEKMAKGKLISKAACDKMIRILLDQKFNEIIPAELPADVKVAHKTGSFTSVHHDSGIVFLPDGRKYVLILLSKNIEDETNAVKAMANVSKMVYRFMNHS